jgi:hypothetical protein
MGCEINYLANIRLKPSSILVEHVNYPIEVTMASSKRITNALWRIYVSGDHADAGTWAPTLCLDYFVRQYHIHQESYHLWNCESQNGCLIPAIDRHTDILRTNSPAYLVKK